MSSNAEIIVPDYKANWEPEFDVWEAQALVESGTGFMSAYGANSKRNYDAYVFMEEQYQRFLKGWMPDEDMLEWCWNYAFYALDHLDPYLFFSGCTDVIKTNEPYYYQFAIRYNDLEPYKEISADSTEMFRYWEGGMGQWELLLNDPGLNSKEGSKFFDVLWDYFSDGEHFNYVANDDHPECYSEELALLKKYGEKTTHIAHLGIWAAVMWMLGPDGRGWRRDHSPIFQMCYDEGSCLLNDWTFFSPQYFKRFERPVKSCAHCGEKQYCVELTQLPEEAVYYEETDVVAIYMCQKCQSNGVPFPGRTCGTKICANLDCSNHPNHSKDLVLSNRARRKADADNRYGELKDVGLGYGVRELPGMMYINQVAINRYSQSIASDVGQKMLEMLVPK